MTAEATGEHAEQPEQPVAEATAGFRTLPGGVALEDRIAEQVSDAPAEPPITAGDLQRNILLFGSRYHLPLRSR